MQLLVLIDLHPGPTPAQERALALMRALAGSETESAPDGLFVPLLVCRKKSFLADMAAAEALPFMALASGLPLHPLSLLRLWMRLRKERNILLHSFGAPAAKLALSLARRGAERAILLHSHFFVPQAPLSKGRQGGLLSPKHYAALDSVICGSAALAKNIGEAAALAPGSGKFQIIPPGVRIDNFPQRHGRSDGRIAICMPGPLTETGGQICLVQAMSALWQVEDLPPWEVRLVGSGPMFQPLLDEAQKLGVLDRLAILGEQDLREVLPRCDLLVLPSGELVYTPWLAEGWASDLPTISPAQPAALELVRNKENALIVPPEDPQALAAAILHILRDADLAQRLALGGRNALPLVSEERMVSACIELYHELAARRGWA